MKKVLILVVFLLLIGAFIFFDIFSYFNLEYFQSQRNVIFEFKNEHFWLSSLLYFVLYVSVAAFSLPAAAILTLAGGAVFGLWWGLVLVSFASTIGATLAFLMARTVLRDWVQNKFGEYLQPINNGVEKDGAFYLFSLRLIPVFPFFLVNLLMALTSIKTHSFYVVSQIGMLFGTALYVNLGAQLGLATSLPDVVGVGVLRAIVVLALFPWVTKWGVSYYRQRKILKGFAKPKKFDTNMIVIGAGSAGLVTSLVASVVKAKVTLIEKNRMGGDCLNTGCVPSKTLIRSANIHHLIKRARDFGFDNASAEVNFTSVMNRVHSIIKSIEPHDSIERYTQLGVDCIEGEAVITSPYCVSVNGQEITTRNIVIATGARPYVPSIPGMEDIKFVTSDTIWGLQKLPQKLLVLGGGPIGCELAQAFSRLGSRVTMVNRSERILVREDIDVSTLVAERFDAEGIRLLNHHKLVGVIRNGESSVATIEHEGVELDIEFDVLLVAAGRQANTEGLGLEAMDITVTKRGNIEVGEYLQTNYPNIYACGDVAGPYQFTHMASFQAWYAAVNSLFGFLKKTKVNYSVVPWATFTDPEVARVGLNERDAREKGIAYDLCRYDIKDLDRAIADGEAYGFIKILTVPGKDRILGVTIVGYHASELISEFVTAMTHGLGLKKIMATIHIYPTLMESNKFAASQWRKQHAPEWLFPYLDKLHCWRRN